MWAFHIVVTFYTHNGLLLRLWISDNNEEIVVATTRLETMLGDTAIAVHPEDERYKHLIGSQAKHPFCNRLLPIIGDDSVKPALGTGTTKTKE